MAGRKKVKTAKTTKSEPIVHQDVEVPKLVATYYAIWWPCPAWLLKFRKPHFTIEGKNGMELVAEDYHTYRSQIKGISFRPYTYSKYEQLLKIKGKQTNNSSTSKGRK